MIYNYSFLCLISSCYLPLSFFLLVIVHWLSFFPSLFSLLSTLFLYANNSWIKKKLILHKVKERKRNQNAQCLSIKNGRIKLVSQNKKFWNRKFEIKTFGRSWTLWMLMQIDWEENPFKLKEKKQKWKGQSTSNVDQLFTNFKNRQMRLG